MYDLDEWLHFVVMVDDRNTDDGGQQEDLQHSSLEKGL